MAASATAGSATPSPAGRPGRSSGPAASRSTPIDPRALGLPDWSGRRDGEGVAAFRERIDRADAFVVVTPEYNHAYPAVLKFMIDCAYAEWQAKPVAFVSYGGISGGLRAVEQLRLVFAELHADAARHGQPGLRPAPLRRLRPADRAGAGDAPRWPSC